MTQNSNDIFHEEDYYFVFDSNSFTKMRSSLYGFAIEDDGLYDNSNYKEFKKEYFSGVGTYVFLNKSKNKITLSQDFNGSIGLFIYKYNDYYAISNSFYTLVEYVKTKYPIHANMDYLKAFMATWITSLSVKETPVKEIEIVPSHAILNVFENGSINYEYIDYAFNSISINSEEGIKLLDNWYTKWIKIIRTIVQKANNVCVDLTGGMDSRLVFLFFLNSGIDLKKIYIRSLNDKLHTHSEDFEIATSISEKYGFVLNQTDNIDKRTCNYSFNDLLKQAYYTKMLFHKELTFPSSRYVKKRYYFGGFGGETIRPYWNMTRNDLIKKQYYYLETLPYGAFKDYSNSINKVLDNSFIEVNKKYNCEDENAYGFNMFRECYSRFHFGRIGTEAVLNNVLKISPILDPLLQKLTLNDGECLDKNLLISVIFTRYANDLLEFPFDSGRIIQQETLKHAKEINEKYEYFKMDDINNEVFNIPSVCIPFSEGDNHKVNRNTLENNYLNLFSSNAFKSVFISYFGLSMYEFIEHQIHSNNYFPLRYVYPAIGSVQLLNTVKMNQLLLNNNLHQTLINLLEADEYAEVDKRFELLKAKTHPMRLDISSNNFSLISVDDDYSVVTKPRWLQKEGSEGYVIQAYKEVFNVSFQSHSEGELHLSFRGVNKTINKKRVPKWIKYKRIVINNKSLLQEPTMAWHDKPIKYNMSVLKDEIINIYIEWIPVYEYINPPEKESFKTKVKKVFKKKKWIERTI